MNQNSSTAVATASSSPSAPIHQPGFFRNALILGLLTALGPFAIDMYLPALPVVGRSLSADTPAVLLSMTAFFVTFALGHLIWGPLSDMWGRKRPLYAGIALFIVASVGCALATSVEMLVVLRLLQGLGGACSIVIPRAIVRDLHSGVDEAKLLSLLMLVMSVSPLLAPLAGSGVVALGSWRAIFWLVTGAAVVGMLLAVKFVRETRPAEAQAGSDAASVLAACRRLLTDREFLALCFIGAFSLSGFFVFLGHSSFIFMGRYGLTPTQYSLTFSVNAAAFFAAMQLNGWLAARVGLRAIVRPAAWGYAAVMTALLALVAGGADSLWVLMTLLFIGYAFVGFLLPITSVLALEKHGDIAGTGSSLLGTLQMATGAIAMALTGLFTNGTALPMVVGIASCALAAFVLAQFVLARR